MDIDNLLKEYKNREPVPYILRALNRVFPEYLWGLGILELARFYDNKELDPSSVHYRLKVFIRDGIVEERAEKLSLEEMALIQERLFQNGKISSDVRITIPERPQEEGTTRAGYRLTEDGSKVANLLIYSLQKPQRARLVAKPSPT